MYINNNSNKQNFTSAYRFRPMSNECYRELLHLVPKSSCRIFNCVSEKGDIVHVNHACYDERVKNFIKSNNLNFEYFPKIKLSDKLNEDILRTLIMRDIAGKDTIRNFFALKSHVIKENILRSKSLLKHYGNIFQTLRLNVDKPEMSIMENGLPKIRDNSKSRSIYFSPNYTSKYYVFIKPDSVNQECSRYLLYSNGKELVKEYKTPKEITDFNRLSCIVSD